MQISKSDYMLFLKHPAWLWVKKNDPSKIPPVDDNTQALFDAGHLFEPYAESLFPEGVTVGFSFDDSEASYWTMPQRTQDAISNGAQVLFQPRFEWDQFTCICDVVSFTGDKQVDLYEIKASTSAKVEHEFDLAFQVAVLEGCGYTVNTISVIHVNNKYVRNGPVKADEITKIEDITDKVRAKGELTAKYMPMALSVVGQKTMPDPSPDLAKLGSKYDWLQIYENIVPQAPKEYPADIQPTVNKEEIKKFLAELNYPLYFLDYETMSGLIPYFDGHRPYQQIPFQYSLHIIRDPGADVEHKEYLHRENSDPSRPLGPEITTEYLNRIGLMTNAYIGSPAPGLLFFASDGVSNMPYDAPGVLPIIHQKNVVIIRYDATSRQLETTLNGQSNGTVNVPAGMNITNSDSLKFGGSKVMYDFYASAIWNQALSETQVQQVNDALAQ